MEAMEEVAEEVLHRIQLKLLVVLLQQIRIKIGKLMEMQVVKESLDHLRGYQEEEVEQVVLEVIGQIQKVGMEVVEKVLYHILELM